MKVFFVYSPLLLASSICKVEAFSATAPSTALPSFLSKPLTQMKRNDLKNQLVKAAESKDEELVLSLVDELSLLNPTSVPTRGLKGYKIEDGISKAPLEGAWKLLYTNAKDAEAPARTEKNSEEKFGDEVAEGVQVKTGQRIDAKSGECVNFIKLSGDEEKRPFDELEITIEMTPISDTRVRLDFLRGRALNERAPLSFLKDFKFSFPPKIFNDLIAIAKGRDPKLAPQTYFDLLYIDDEIRAHKTGEGKIFVQRRDVI